MNIPMTNGHMHVFISECAPPGFFKVREFKWLKLFAKPIKYLLERHDTRRWIWSLNRKIKFLSRYRKIRLERVISFLNTGSQISQTAIFEQALVVAKNYDSNPHLIAHTLDMDNMDTNSKPIINYQTQLYEVLEIKRFYPDNIFPFIGVDPRTKSGKELVDWIKYYFDNGVKSKVTNKILPFVSGIKIYPAHGHFPFDPRLDELYEYAEKNKIPIMFHCTRVGSQYIGTQIENLIPLKPEMIMPATTNILFTDAENTQKEIYNRIARYYQKKGWIKNSRIGKNEFACDLFSHPQNYIPIMCKYPKLKICLAHMGGFDEVNNMHLTETKWHTATVEDKKLKEIWQTDGYNWARLLKNMMTKYKCLYTDISSTITHLNETLIAQNISNWLNTKDKNEKELGNRILFGTDFFMTEISNSEDELYGFMTTKLAHWFKKMSGENINNYLP